MYGTEAAEVYDLLHRARGKNFEDEAEAVLELALGRRPAADSLLDVACGTGAHLRVFGKRFDQVAGVDLSAAMLELAGARLPEAELTQADMRDFSLGRRFDVITCLFCSIAYVRSTGELEQALRGFARHLTPGGVTVVEPWWFPERFTPGYIAADVVREGGRTVSRVSHASRIPAGSRMEVHYLVAEEDSGVRHFREEHLYSLFSRQEYEAAFDRAGFDVEYVPDAGRGLFTGVLRG
ncbi:Methyltransferase domain-containing protein [Amycolatopsis lurida]|uniref:SAM-dependent methyltransferase n=1 Tax=Amycolatopsis lurida NRRL 2430 TaxID=1460371 RepID=A0A2P2FW25_AMYLU|nr:class I SAM-dependent methyltransferase [Amycolatopsis lurida]KFU80937.1 SAM-dependent methyltransferase [Amycolatopsis lurida NRRL 2430]SED90466.1 Methyltransferase domain-containing protein [Amycolatopsis lurida]